MPRLTVNKAFKDNWFNKTHNMDISKDDLIELLSVATKNQLFQFNGSLYEQVDGVAMGSPLGPLMDLLTCLNEAHPSIQFTMEIVSNDRLPFIGMEITKIDGSLETSVYRKKTNKGLLLHYPSHVDSRYKRSLLRTLSRFSKHNATSKEDGTARGIVWTRLPVHLLTSSGQGRVTFTTAFSVFSRRQHNAKAFIQF